MWCVIWPVVWLRPTRSSYEAEPIQMGRPSSLTFPVFQKRDVVALAGVVADRLLERQVFLATEQEEIADGGFVVRARQHRIFGDLQVALQTQARRPGTIWPPS